MMRDSFKEAAVLNFDGSVSLGDIARFDFRRYEEQIRYCASFSDIRILENAIREVMESHNIFFLGNGDFHHVSYQLIKLIPQINLHVVVFDNHPDNMFFPSGIHCGSWVYHASRLPNVSNIAVFGISSSDISGFDLFQNRLSVVRAGKVEYYCLTHVSRLAKLLSGGNIEDISISQGDMRKILQDYILNSESPVYLSIDKDVLTGEFVRTTWDQGKMTENELLECIGKIAHRVVAADVVGDISLYRYKSPMKRLLRWMDGREQIPNNIQEEQLKHRDINLRILSLLQK